MPLFSYPVVHKSLRGGTQTHIHIDTHADGTDLVPSTADIEGMRIVENIIITFGVDIFLCAKVKNAASSWNCD